MFKHFKKMALMLFASIAVFSFIGCGEKENENEPPNGNENQEVLANTRWVWQGEATVNMVSAEILFTPNYSAKLTFLNTDYNEIVLEGTYTYSDGQGTMDLKYQTTHQPISPTFTIEGNTLSLKIFGKTYTLTKM